MRKKTPVVIVYMLLLFLLISCKSEVTSKIIYEESETDALDDNVKIANQEKTSDEKKDEEDTIIFAEKLAYCENINDKISAIYDYLDGKWTLTEYINLVWYTTGEENDEELRSNYEEGYVDYLGQDFVFNKESILIPAYADGINVCNDFSDYINKFSINKELRAPIVEVYGEMVDADNENVRFIFDGNGETYLEYKNYFFRLEKNK